MPTECPDRGRMKWPYTVWQWANKHAILSALFVTAVGVLIAFLLAGWGGRKALNRATEQRLHLVVLEVQYNGTIAKEVVDGSANSSAATVRTERPHTPAAAAALQDSNILASLPYHKVSLLRSYIDAVATLNEALEVHQRVLEVAGYVPTPAEATIRQQVRSEAAAVLAMAVVVREELDSYFDPRTYDHEAMRRIEDRVKLIKGKALIGQVSLSKEE